MDKVEYRELVRAIKNNYLKKDYEGVISVAEQLEPEKIRENSILEIIAKAYDELGRSDLARETLLIAYKRTPTGKRIAYNLAMLSIKLEDLDSAVMFYEDFCKMAPKDNQRLILKYEIGKAGGVPIENLAKVLEKYNSREMDDRWEYELARLYHEMGDDDRCAAVCDQIILWYANGEYEKKALELKNMHKALNPAQQARYEEIMQGVLNGTYAPEPEADLAKTQVIPPLDTTDKRLEMEHLSEADAATKVIDTKEIAARIAQDQAEREAAAREEAPQSEQAPAEPVQEEETKAQASKESEDAAKAAEEVPAPQAAESQEEAVTEEAAVPEEIPAAEVSEIPAADTAEETPEEEAAPAQDTAEPSADSLPEIDYKTKHLDPQALESGQKEETRDEEVISGQMSLLSMMEAFKNQSIEEREKMNKIGEDRAARIFAEVSSMHDSSILDQFTDDDFDNENVDEVIEPEVPLLNRVDTVVPIDDGGKDLGEDDVPRRKKVSKVKTKAKSVMQEKEQSLDATQYIPRDEIAARLAMEEANESDQEEAAAEVPETVSAPAFLQDESLEDNTGDYAESAETDFTEEAPQAEDTAQEAELPEAEWEDIEASAPEIPEEEIETVEPLYEEVIEEEPYREEEAGALGRAIEKFTEEFEEAFEEELPEGFAEEFEEELPEEPGEEFEEETEEEFGEEFTEEPDEYTYRRRRAVKRNLTEEEEIAAWKQMRAEAEARLAVVDGTYEEVEYEELPDEDEPVLPKEEGEEFAEEPAEETYREEEYGAYDESEEYAEFDESEEYAESEESEESDESEEYAESEEYDEFGDESYEEDEELQEETRSARPAILEKGTGFLKGLFGRVRSRHEAVEEEPEDDWEEPYEDESEAEDAEPEEAEEISAEIKETAPVETSVPEEAEETAEDTKDTQDAVTDAVLEAFLADRAADNSINKEETMSTGKKEEAISAPRRTAGLEPLEDRKWKSNLAELKPLDMISKPSKETPAQPKENWLEEEVDVEEFLEPENRRSRAKGRNRKNVQEESIAIDPEQLFAEMMVDQDTADEIPEEPADTVTKTLDFTTEPSVIEETEEQREVVEEPVEAEETPEQLEAEIAAYEAEKPAKRKGFFKSIFRKDRTPREEIAEEEPAPDEIEPEQDADFVQPAEEAFTDEAETVQETIENTAAQAEEIQEEVREAAQEAADVSAEVHDAESSIREEIKTEAKQAAMQREEAETMIRDAVEAVRETVADKPEPAADEVVLDDEKLSSILRASVAAVKVAEPVKPQGKTHPEPLPEAPEEAMETPVVVPAAPQPRKKSIADLFHRNSRKDDEPEQQLDLDSLLSASVKADESDTTSAGPELDLDALLNSSINQDVQADSVPEKRKESGAKKKSKPSRKQAPKAQPVPDLDAILAGAIRPDSPGRAPEKSMGFEDLFGERANAIPAKKLDTLKPYKLSKEQRKDLGEFLLIEGMEEEICTTIDKLVKRKKAGDETGGHLIVTGDAKTGKTFLTIEILKAVNEEAGYGNPRVAKVQSQALNGKNIKKVLSKVTDSDLIIENIGRLEDDTVRDLISAVRENNASTMVILEGNELAADTLIQNFPAIGRIFKTRINIGELTLTQWADVAMKYANGQGYRIDDVALLALHARIDAINTPDIRLGFSQVREVVDQAIDRADGRNAGKRRKNADALIPLIEDDFI